MKKLTFMLVLAGFSGYCQAQRLAAFDNLIGGKWSAEGEWNDGTPFKQEITFEKDVDGKVIKATSDGYTDFNATNYGRRSFGVRAWNKDNNAIEFWELDVFGNITQGKCKIAGDHIYYVYTYSQGQGYITMTDAWIKVDGDKYEFKVGVLEGTTWKEVYLETVFVRIVEDREGNE